MIAGRVPFPVVSLPEKLYAHQLHDPEPLTELAAGIPEGLSEVVLKMMRKLPEDRYQTPLEVAQALEPFAIATGWTTTPATSPSTSSSGSGINRVRSSSDIQSRPKTKTVEMGAVVVEAPSSWISSLNAARSGQPASGSDSKSPASGTTSNHSGSSSTGGSTGTGESAFLPLDLGADEPLSQGLNPSSKSRSKSKSKSDVKPKAKAAEKLPAEEPAGSTPPRKPNKTLIAAGAVGGVLLLATVVVIATMVLAGNGKGNGKTASSGNGKGVATETDKTNDKGKIGGKSTVKSVNPPVKGEIVVQFKDGTSEVAKTLTQALGLASNNRGAEVILGDGIIRIDNSATIRIPSFGSLTLRAAEGARPTLEVKLKGVQPMFLVNANLHLEGLKVVVRYETPSEAIVFQAERDLTMDRCSFWAIGPAEGSRFALAEGSKATVTGCLFQGFETALQIEANPGMAIALKQSVFLSAKAGDEIGGRAAKFHSILGKGAGCRLLVENCSVRSGTFLDVSDFSPTTPLQIDSASSAFLVKTLLGFEGEPKMPLGTADSTVRWKGRDNRYNVKGPNWASFPSAPTDLESWSKLTSDTGSKAIPLKPAKEPADPTSTKDYALLDESDKLVGADPDNVGPALKTAGSSQDQDLFPGDAMSTDRRPHARPAIEYPDNDGKPFRDDPNVFIAVENPSSVIQPHPRPSSPRRCLLDWRIRCWRVRDRFEAGSALPLRSARLA